MMPDSDVTFTSEWKPKLTGIRIEVDPYYGTRHGKMVGLYSGITGVKAINVLPVPETATLPEIIWTSSDSNVVKIQNDDIMTWNTIGTATCTAATADGKFSDSVTIEVFDRENGYTATILDSYASETPQIMLFPGTIIPVNAGNHPNGRVFDHWEGVDIDLKFINSKSTDLKAYVSAPGRDVTIRAVWTGPIYEL